MLASFTFPESLIVSFFVLFVPLLVVSVCEVLSLVDLLSVVAVVDPLLEEVVLESCITSFLD